MELDDLKSQWGDMTKDLNKAKPVSIPAKGTKLSKPKAVKELAEMNLAELLANFASIPFLLYCWLFTDLLDSFTTGFNFLFLIGGLLILTPSMILFWQLQNPQPNLPSLTFLRRLVRLIDLFKWVQIVGNFLLTLVILIPGMFFYGNFNITIDGEVYHRLIDLPDPKYQSMSVMIFGFAAVFSVLGAVWGYLLYFMFYHFRRKELVEVMKQLKEE